MNRDPRNENVINHGLRSPFDRLIFDMLPSLLTVPTKVGRHVVSDDSDKMIAIYVRTLIRTVKSFNFVLVIGRLSIVGLIILIVGFSVRTVYNDSPLANVSMVLKNEVFKP